MYIILEAHHRFTDPSVADLWSLIQRVYAVHPEARSASERPEIAAVARITVAAWQQYDAHLQQQANSSAAMAGVAREIPEWIAELCRNFGVQILKGQHGEKQQTAEESAQMGVLGVGEGDGSEFLLPADFDFDMIDWSIWEEARMNG